MVPVVCQIVLKTSLLEGGSLIAAGVVFDVAPCSFSF